MLLLPAPRPCPTSFELPTRLLLAAEVAEAPSLLPPAPGPDPPCPLLALGDTCSAGSLLLLPPPPTPPARPLTESAPGRGRAPRLLLPALPIGAIVRGEPEAPIPPAAPTNVERSAVGDPSTSPADPLPPPPMPLPLPVAIGGRSRAPSVLPPPLAALLTVSPPAPAGCSLPREPQSDEDATGTADTLEPPKVEERPPVLLPPPPPPLPWSLLWPLPMRCWGTMLLLLLEVGERSPVEPWGLLLEAAAEAAGLADTPGLLLLAAAGLPPLLLLLLGSSPSARPLVPRVMPAAPVGR
jgi:hypothetical protein